LWWDLPVKETFDLLKEIYKVEDKQYKETVKELNKLLNLEEYWDRPVRKLSLGQRMRAEVAASLLHRPKIIFLDEPTIGIDVVGKSQLRSFIREVNKRFGTTLILTSHDMKDVEKICDRAIVIRKGRIVFDNKLDRLKKDYVKTKILKIIFKEKKKKINGLKSEIKNEYTHLVEVKDKDVAKTLAKIMKENDVADIQILEQDITEIVEKVFRDG
jgi:ABC-2 type transport system ATP-binding protein